MEADKPIVFIWFIVDKWYPSDLLPYEMVDIINIPIKGINNKRTSNMVVL